ncbi:MAG: biopolymer transporter ExbD [Planctomycetota bacterium]|nr:biopolymer transporter ExbD [Planctomycetota bacterium]MDA1249954.1 biopolymer transporter ExbD [Planctomycetota bacterium]
MARSLSGGSGFKKKSSKADEADLDITPMIDVTFLLLIFFMVTSTMQQESAVNVPPANFGVGKDANTSTIVTILAPKGGGVARVLLGDGSGDEARSMETVTAYVQAGVAEGKRQVIIKADRDVSHGKVQEVLKALGEIEELQFAVGVEEVK